MKRNGFVLLMVNYLFIYRVIYLFMITIIIILVLSVSFFCVSNKDHSLRKPSRSFWQLNITTRQSNEWLIIWLREIVFTCSIKKYSSMSQRRRTMFETLCEKQRRTMSKQLTSLFFENKKVTGLLKQCIALSPHLSRLPDRGQHRAVESGMVAS